MKQILRKVAKLHTDQYKENASVLGCTIPKCTPHVIKRYITRNDIKIIE